MNANTQRKAAARAALVFLLAALFLADSIQAQSSNPEDGYWPADPEGTLTVLLLTGADGAYVEPKGCYGGMGGSHYRSAFNKWLDAHSKKSEKVWIGTGNVLTIYPNENTAGPEKMYRQLGRIGYRALGIGRHDLDISGPSGVLALTERFKIPLVATNLVDAENGAPITAPYLSLDLRAGKLAVFALLRYQPEGQWQTSDGRIIRTIPPAQALAEPLRRAKAEGRKVLLLSTLLHRSLRLLLREFPDIDFVAASIGTLRKTEAEEMEGIPVLWLGYQGQSLGRLALGAGMKPLAFGATTVWRDFPVDPLSGKFLEDLRAEQKPRPAASTQPPPRP